MLTNPNAEPYMTLRQSDHSQIGRENVTDLKITLKKTRSAGPVMKTEWPDPSHAMERLPPGMQTCAGRPGQHK